MDYSKLQKFSFTELKNIAKEMKLKPRRDKQSLLNDIINGFKEYENYKHNKIDKYERVKQLGERGKEGVTYLVRTKDGKEYAMKTFRKQKSSITLKREADLQRLAAAQNISPDVIEIDTVFKYIVMEKMDRHLIDVMKKQNGDLTKSQQLAIIKLFKKLDTAGVFHADSNLLNYMYKKRKLYIIDFGMAKQITPKLIKKLGTSTPNMSIMLLGFILKLKELKCPETSFQYLLPYLNNSGIIKF